MKALVNRTEVNKVLGDQVLLSVEGALRLPLIVYLTCDRQRQEDRRRTWSKRKIQEQRGLGLPVIGFGCGEMCNCFFGITVSLFIFAAVDLMASSPIFDEYFRMFSRKSFSSVIEASLMANRRCGMLSFIGFEKR